MQAYVVQYLAFAVFIVTEGNITELNVAFFHLFVGERGGGVRNINFFVHDSLDSACRRHRAGRLHKEHGDHHEGGKDLRDIGDKGCQVAN